MHLNQNTARRESSTDDWVEVRRTLRAIRSAHPISEHAATDGAKTTRQVLDYRDLVIADLALLLVSAEHSRDAYRELLRVALALLRDTTHRHTRLVANLFESRHGRDNDEGHDDAEGRPYAEDATSGGRS
jgi:hypothetical protein